MLNNSNFRGRAIFYCPTCIELLEQPIKSYFETDHDDKDDEMVIVCPKCFRDAYFKFIVNDTNGEARCDYTWYHIFRDYREHPNHEIEFRRLPPNQYHNFDTGEIKKC